ncbi:MAG: glucose 1-dehydrogenase [Cyanobacteria bacterium M_surface_10_m2_119]|nr:glucose 1-dehydrogenase [Cyanobacteria bacterium M_surface_10_m2_119]
MFDLSGKVAIVTGGDGGIGLGMARGLARAGASIVVAARNPEKSADAVAELQVLGAQAIAIETDVSRESSITALMEQTVAYFGRLDVLVNNAGTNVRLPAQELTLEQWQQVLDTNLTGAFLCAKAAYPHLRGGGKVINVGSMLSLFGSAVAAAYGASKGGVVQLTKSLAVGWAADGIQVNAILPGWIDTALTRTAREQLPGLNERVLARSPSGRWGVPADFEGIAVFLASEASAFITGAAIPVDGGYASEV